MLDNIKEFLEDQTIYQPDQIEEVIKQVRKNFRFSQLNTKHKYFNVPCSFDIETTSFYDQTGEKTGIMYIWMFGIYGLVIIGRTWEEFKIMIEKLITILDLKSEKRLICYVHNLQFDFQFFRKHFNFEKVFAIDKRKPLYALTDSGIEFRCSYLLSGYSLETVGKNLLMFPVQKMSGDLDYDLIRHSETPLTKKELLYCMNDVKVVMSYISEEIIRAGGIANLPYTKTGYVRRYCRNQCLYEAGVPRKKSTKRLKFHDMMEPLTLTPKLYDKLREGFAGGFTHANAIYSGKTVYNVSSYDITSSYPTVMIAERFPMSHPEEIDTRHLTEQEFYENIKNYCCLFTIHFHNLKAKPETFENYISASHCIYLEKEITNNGRIVQADLAVTTITEIDFEIIDAFYTWDSFQISYMVKWVRGWLPKDLILAILKLYEDKTTLKGVPGKEAEYMVSKGMLNSIYGMSCSRLLRPVNDYINEWLEPYFKDPETVLNKYNKNWSRFLYYPWGLYVTAYARKNLFLAIQECGTDYVYSDTDSVKFKNLNDHKPFFESYNQMIISRLKYALQDQQIDTSLIEPCDRYGNKKPLGIYDYEGTYTRFKTLGAKRYLLEKDGKIELTVSGLNKKFTVPFMCTGWFYDLKTKQSKNDPFEMFQEGMHIPADYTGKKTHTYIDKERSGTLYDYLGNEFYYSELSGIHLEGASYDLSIGRDYKEFLKLYIGGMHLNEKIL